jgi:predicted glycosyltransferase
MTKPKVFFYVQHLLGIGHSMRAALLTRAMTEAGLEVTLVNGGEPTNLDDPGAVRSIQLTPARAADPSFSTIVDAAGTPIDDAWKQLRQQALLKHFEAAKPDIVLIETFPFGRWPFRFEIFPLLDAAREKCRVLCSIRDILVPKKSDDRNREIVSIIKERFDGILVHGDETLFKLDETFVHAGEIQPLIYYTGYVAPQPEDPNGEVSNQVIVSAGGGGTGEQLMSAVLDAFREPGAPNLQLRFMIGPNMSSAFAAKIKKTPGIIVEPVRTDFRSLLAGAALSVSQAGYNTVMDILVSRARNVLIPFSQYGQTEQAMRARFFSQKGMAVSVDENTLTPAILLAAIHKGLEMKRPNPSSLNLKGAEKSAQLVLQLARGGM